MIYLDQPLQAVEQTQEKARILTVLGYSQRWLNRRDEAIALHQEALQLAQDAGDRYCEVANLNHLARLALDQSDYEQAISLAQRALIVSRNNGDRQGEANALASVGYSEVMQIRQQEMVTPEQMERPFQYLKQGKTLSEKQQDLQSQAFCLVGLGLGYVSLEQPQDAKAVLEISLPILQQVGDLDLRALSYACLGETYYQLNQTGLAVFTTCLAMYWLHERGNKAWRQSAALATILQGQLGDKQWNQTLQQYRSKFISQIGVDGLDYLPQLIDDYRR
ncbi:MAG: tetratricopeptide repeat protein [Merismopedia sp. SIO2A8]|nr:tetratricopeptide repeat protein [Merismopedia sp. SIO2A8]